MVDAARMMPLSLWASAAGNVATAFGVRLARFSKVR